MIGNINKVILSPMYTISLLLDNLYSLKDIGGNNVCSLDWGNQRFR